MITPYLVWSALTIIQRWVAAGQPSGSATFGMFESWAETMGGILATAGIPGFLGNVEDLRKENDAETAALSVFTRGWFEKYGEREVGAAELGGGPGPRSRWAGSSGGTASSRD